MSGLTNALANQVNVFAPFMWQPIAPAQLQSQLGALAQLRAGRQTAKQRRDTACQWFATKWRQRASEIGIQCAARLMRKQGVPVEVAVSILATR